MFNTSARLDQRFTGVLFCALTAVGVIAVGGAAFDDGVDARVVAASPAAGPTLAAAPSTAVPAPMSKADEFAALTAMEPTAASSPAVALVTAR